jgi:hypothetical protein
VIDKQEASESQVHSQEKLNEISAELTIFLANSPDILYTVCDFKVTVALNNNFGM